VQFQRRTSANNGGGKSYNVVGQATNNGKAFELLQEDKTVNLVSWAKANPTEFYRLASKLIPLQLETETQQATQTIIQIVPVPYIAPIND
jgi:hypothetical protein